jgi:transketolase
MNRQSTFSEEKSKLFSLEIRKKTLEMVYKAKASHIGGALSMVDVLAVLYSNILNIDPLNPNWEQRDRFLLSKGHACTSLYVTLALSKIFPDKLLNEYGINGTLLLSHTSNKIPGVELSTGSLGHALPVGCGLSLAAKRQKKDFNTYILVGDGELDEGSNWESILFAPQHKLDNLILIVDYNKIQSFGTTEEVINLESLSKKFEAFNWEVFEIDGHDHSQIYETFSSMKKNSKPKVVIANTIKGKGVDFMENKLLWHYKSPSNQEFKEAMNQLTEN